LPPPPLAATAAPLGARTAAYRACALRRTSAAPSTAFVAHPMRIYAPGLVLPASLRCSLDASCPTLPDACAAFRALCCSGRTLGFPPVTGRLPFCGDCTNRCALCALSTHCHFQFSPACAADAACCTFAYARTSLLFLASFMPAGLRCHLRLLHPRTRCAAGLRSARLGWNALPRRVTPRPTPRRMEPFRFGHNITPNAPHAVCLRSTDTRCALLSRFALRRISSLLPSMRRRRRTLSCATAWIPHPFGRPFPGHHPRHTAARYLDCATPGHGPPSDVLRGFSQTARTAVARTPRAFTLPLDFAFYYFTPGSPTRRTPGLFTGSIVHKHTFFRIQSLVAIFFTHPGHSRGTYGHLSGFPHCRSRTFRLHFITAWRFAHNSGRRHTTFLTAASLPPATACRRAAAVLPLHLPPAHTCAPRNKPSSAAAALPHTAAAHRRRACRAALPRAFLRTAHSRAAPRCLCCRHAHHHAAPALHAASLSAHSAGNAYNVTTTPRHQRRITFHM